MKNEKEYLMLRDEITWRLKSIDTLGAFTYTTLVTILGAALTTNIIELFLLPFVVILPISLKVANHKYSINFISAYLNQFLEDFNDEECFQWEKLRVKYYERNPRKLKEKIIFYGSYVEYILMCILISVIFWVKYFSQEKICFTVFQIYGYIFIQLTITFLVTFITINYLDCEKFKLPIIENWKKLKENE